MLASAVRLGLLALSLPVLASLASPLPDPGAEAEQVFASNETSTVTGSESYGILLDAGSSSTKLKIYKWTKPESSPGVPNVTLININDKKKRKFRPGLAGLDGGRIKTYLLNILLIAQGYVPAAQHAETPVFVLATAGFRLLGVAGAREEIHGVEEVLLNSTLHPFLYTPGSASVLSGEEEAAYAWLAANYLLGFFQDNRPDSQSVGVLEMGGGSTQIAFIPHDPLMAEEFQVVMAGRMYSLYVQSYLQFGLNAIRRRLEEQLVCSPHYVLDVESQPCMLNGDAKNFTGCEDNVTVLLQGTGNPSECQRLYDQLVASAPPGKCYLEPCAIGSVFQPNVEGINFYAISAYVYSLKAAGAVRDDQTLDLNILWSKAQEYCKQDITDIPERGRDFASANCMEAIYSNEILTKPYGFPKSTNRIKVTSEIGGNDIEWALGAMLELLSLSFTGDPNHCSLTRK